MHMPVMDGFEATRRIRRDLGLTDLPVLALTAGATVAERELAQAAGVQAFISKPFEPRRLLQVIAGFLGVQGDDTAASAKDAEPKIAGWPRSWPHTQGLDARGVQERFAGNLDLYSRMLRKALLNERPPAMPSSPWHADQRDQFLSDIHRLNGSVGTLGLTVLQGLASDIETHIRSQQDDQAQALYPSLVQEFERLQGWCQSLPLPAESAQPTGEPIDLQASQLANLRKHLEDNDVRAGALFRTLAPALQTRLAPEAFARLEADIYELRYEEALAELHHLDTG
jgi:CheY-like chemotaxis protein